MPARTPTPTRTRAPRISPLLYLPANYLGVRPALGAAATTSPACASVSTGPARRPLPGVGAPPAAAGGLAGALPTAPARRLAGGGGARAPAPLKFESRYQPVRNPEIPDAPLKMFSPEVESGWRGRRARDRLATEETLCCCWGSKLFIVRLYICG